MNTLTVGVLIAATALLASCASTVQVDDTKESGFLGDNYAKLTPGDGPTEAARRYINPKLDLKKFSKIMVDPVVFFGDEDKQITGEDRQQIVDNFYAALRNAAGEHFQLTDRPGAGTARMQVAIVKASKKNVTMDTVSTVLPIGLVASAGNQFVTGKPAFTGALAIEFKLTDSQTGELLAAGVDERVGGKEMSGDKMNAWDDVNKAIRFYGTLFSYRLCVNKGLKDCKPPAEQNL